MAKKYFVEIEATIEVEPEDLDEKGNFKRSYELFTSMEKFGIGISYGDKVEVVDENNF